MLAAKFNFYIHCIVSTSMIQLLIFSCLLGLGLAWNQPSTCCAQQSSCTGTTVDYREDIRGIKDSLESNLMSIQNGIASLAASASSISMSLQQLVEESRTTPGSYSNPARSCSDIPLGRPSGDYWIMTNKTSSPVQVYCNMNRTSCSCNTTGGWMKVANIDMTDPTQNCPAGFRKVNRASAPLRTCGRPGPNPGCVSTAFSSYGVQYSNVCGRIIGYQDSTPDSFKSATIDNVYVDGISLTHGSPRQHIWTFAGASDEVETNGLDDCPCSRSNVNYTGMVPSFVGQDYFCDTGSREHWQVGVFYADDPLWDGQGCGDTSTCCEFNNPPWFCRQLPQPTTDDIELRICGSQEVSDEDTPFELVEIYIQQ